MLPYRVYTPQDYGAAGTVGSGKYMNLWNTATRVGTFAEGEDCTFSTYIKAAKRV